MSKIRACSYLVLQPVTPNQRTNVDTLTLLVSVLLGGIKCIADVILNRAISILQLGLIGAKYGEGGIDWPNKIHKDSE